MSEKGPYKDKVQACVTYLRNKIPVLPQTIIQLGTGLGDFGNRVENKKIIAYTDIPYFPQSTVASHHGNLIVGTIFNHPVAVLQGRFHYYEGYSTKEISLPIRALSLLGAKRFIVTNAAGGLNPLFPPGSIMIIRDHLNFLGENPLRGKNIDKWGPRFPDLSTPYHPLLIKTAFDAASTCNTKNVVSGVYVCIPGPSLETPSETRWLKGCGVDAVGMSSVPEVIVAIHGGLDVLGLSVVSNVNDPDNFQPIILEDIIETAAEVGPRLEKLLGEIINRIQSENR